MTTLSRAKSKVSWRLNELLTAGKKAKAFAQSQWDIADEVQMTKFEAFEPKVISDDDAFTNAESDEGAAAPLSENIDYEIAQSTEEALEEECAANQVQHDKFSREALEQAIDAAELVGYENGIRVGRERWEKGSQDLEGIVKVLSVSSNDFSNYFAPLKKLAVHLAEQLVRGELSTSSDTVGRLVKSAVDFVGDAKLPGTTMYLNPEDLIDLQACETSLPEQLAFRSDVSLSRGSIRTSLNDTGIEDFLENRLESLSQEVFDQVAVVSPDEMKHAPGELVKDDTTDGFIDNSERSGDS